LLLDLDRLIQKYNLQIDGVIHIGAHLGQELSIYKELSIDKIAFFEPQKAIFGKLKKALTDTKNIKLYNLALGNETGSIKMYIDSYNQGSSSVLKPKLHLNQYPHILFEREELVNIDKLDNIINSNDYNLINMDVQGFELEVLKGGVNCIKNINYIITEVNREEVYENCAKIEELDKFLYNHGFVRVETTWDGGNWGDAFYIRKNSNQVLKNISLLTYSHNSFNDVLNIYFNQLKKYFSQLQGYLVSNAENKEKPSNFNMIFYNDSLPYYKHMIDALSIIPEKYIIYMQDDYFFIDEPNFKLLDDCLKKIIYDNLDFIRLIRSGNDMVHENNIFHEISCDSESLFSMQATLWRKKTLMKIFTDAYENHKNDNIWESESRLNAISQKNKLNGVFVYKNEKKRGLNHWDSKIFPYIATAIIKGKWNFVEYKKELLTILISNNISLNRGSNLRGLIKKIFLIIQYKLLSLKK